MESKSGGVRTTGAVGPKCSAISSWVNGALVLNALRSQLICLPTGLSGIVTVVGVSVAETFVLLSEVCAESGPEVHAARANTAAEASATSVSGRPFLRACSSFMDSFHQRSLRRASV